MKDKGEAGEAFLEEACDVGQGVIQEVFSNQGDRTADHQSRRR